MVIRGVRARHKFFTILDKDIHSSMQASLKRQNKVTFHRGSYLANRVIGLFLGGTVGKKVRGICLGTTILVPWS